MKIVIAPDSFKGSLTAAQAAKAIEEGILRAFPEARCVKVPVADGGEGTVDAIVAATGGKRRYRRVSDPRGQMIRAQFGVFDAGRQAVVELAAASGLTLLSSSHRDPTRTSTFGSGELLRAAMNTGAKRIVIGLGGSATNDCGAGIAQALGVKFFDKAGKILPPGISGGVLHRVADFDTREVEPLLREIDLTIACDVENPLVGANGATHVYGRQKGANEGQIAELEHNVRHFAAVIGNKTGQRIARTAGMGAAGGAAAGLSIFAGASLQPGAELVLDAIAFKRKLRGTDLVITGEGRMDHQTTYGKAPYIVARAAADLDIPVIGLGGALSDEVSRLFEVFDALEGAVSRPIDEDEALGQARRYLRNAGERVGRWLQLTKRLRKPD